MVDNHELEIDNLKKQLQSAYRKYKNHIYYDNHSAIQRLELAHFEFDNFRNDDSNANFNSNVDSFFHKFAESLLNDFDKVTDEFLKNINVISFPKTFLDSDNNNEFISNFNETCYDVNRIHYLYDKIEPKCLKKCIENCKLDYCKSNIINIKSNKKDSIKVGLINVKLFKENFVSRLKNSPNLSYKRFDSIKKIINDAIKNEVELLLMPEMYIPYEWVDAIVKISKDHQMAIIFGVEPILNGNAVGNYIMATFPFLVSEKYYESLLIYRIKNHYANEELKMFMKYDKNPNIVVNPKYYLVLWHDIFIAPYYCFEIANIHDRGLFKSCCDIVTVSEFNKDTNYFNNIAESLSRDLFCYCIKTNTSEFGGACILQPASSEKKYLVNLKGGDDDYIVTHELDIKKLREDAIKKDIYSDDSYFKPKPPGFDMDIVKHRMNLD